MSDRDWEGVWDNWDRIDTTNARLDYYAARRNRPLNTPPHEFARRGNPDGGLRDRLCVECGLTDTNPVHDEPQAKGRHA